MVTNVYTAQTPKIPEKLPEEIPMTNRSLMIKAIENDRKAFYERLYEKYAQLDAATNEEDEAEGSFALSDDGDWDVGDFHIPSPIPLRNERFQEYVQSHALYYEEAQSVLGEVHHLEEEPTEDIIIHCFGSDTEEYSETDDDSPRQNQSTPLVDPLEEKNGISTMTPILPLPRTTSPRARRNICPSFTDEIALSPPAKDQMKAISLVAPKRSEAKSPIHIVQNGPEFLKKTGKLNKKHPSWRDESLADSTLANLKSLVKTPKVRSPAKPNHDTPKISYKKSPQTPQNRKKTTTALPKVADDDTPPVEPALKGSSKAMTVKGKANSSKAKKTTKAASPNGS
ncbi:uncharacterized protein LOC131889783 [Tigriopus californicus]|uniref:uncharacterized protein LOC131889783 n=1 Tax=Tigriopus californicus TaxID=6832 RepID=UPI0027DA3228|nr:uncharacterized protein LOC131889783 [Tigriopus californicus]